MDANKAFTFIPESASNFAPKVDALFIYLTSVSVVFTVAIFLCIAVFALRYRRRRSDDIPAAVPPSTMLEIAWMVFPFFLLLIMFVWGASLFVQMRRPPSDAIEIDVLAKQWMWKTQHPNGTREINTLTIPVNHPIKLVMRSEDVIHSFFVPAFRIKQDVVPGRSSEQWFTATVPGTYELFCAEYCGTGHSKMRGRVIVLTPQEYDAWLIGTPSEVPPAVAGAKLFKLYGCNQCHSSQAPTLSGLYQTQVRLNDGQTVLADEDYLRESILVPQAKLVAGFGPIMPSFRERLSEEQINALIAYIKSIGPGAGPVERPPSASQPVAEPPPAPTRLPVEAQP